MTITIRKTQRGARPWGAFWRGRTVRGRVTAYSRYFTTRAAAEAFRQSQTAKTVREEVAAIGAALTLMGLGPQSISVGQLGDLMTRLALVYGRGVQETGGLR